MEYTDEQLLDRLSDFSAVYNEFVFQTEQQISNDEAKGDAYFSSSINYSFVEWSVLCILFIHGTMTMSELAKATRLNPAHLSMIAGGLENKRFVRRFQKKNNRRTNYIELTELGARGRMHQLDLRIAFQKEIFNNNFSDEEIESISEAYDYLNELYAKIQQKLGVL